MKKIMLSMLVASSLALMTSCDKDDDDNTTPPVDNSNLNLNLSGLEDLGPDYRYEGWIIVNGSPVTTGVFTVDADGTPSQTGFTVSESDRAAASTFVLTIEPHPDTDPAPSPVHILAGDFDADAASLTVGHGAALGDDYSAATGGYILATPTDSDMDNEKSGVWFLDPALGPGPALDLPTLPAGWAYEGWVVLNGAALSTGTFTALDAMDDAAPYSGTLGGPPFPGEDFLMNAPEGQSFPTDLSEATVVVSIEPVPDNSTAPFTLKPLVAGVPANALDHTLYGMMNNSTSSFPSGSVMR